MRHGLKTANLADWQLSEENEFIYLKFSDPSFAVPKSSVIIEENFCFTIAIFNWKLPITHSIYGDNKQSLKHLKISLFLSRIFESQICHGISNYNVAESAIIHAIPKTLSLTSDSQFECTIYKQAQTCRVLLDMNASSKCFDCQHFENKANAREKKKRQIKESSLKDIAPLSASSPSRLRATVLDQCLKCKQLEHKIEKLQTEVNRASIKIDNQLSDDITTIMSAHIQEASPFMKLFWNEQIKNFDQKSRRYHPMIIRFCLAIASKSGSAMMNFMTLGCYAFLVGGPYEIIEMLFVHKQVSTFK